MLRIRIELDTTEHKYILKVEKSSDEPACPRMSVQITAPCCALLSTPHHMDLGARVPGLRAGTSAGRTRTPHHQSGLVGGSILPDFYREEVSHQLQREEA